MRWRGRRQSSNIEDRRGGGLSSRGMRIPIRAGGGGGLGFIVIILFLWFAFGINPLQLLGQMEGGGTQTANGPGVEGTQSEADDFVATVLADTEDVWSARVEEAMRRWKLMSRSCRCFPRNATMPGSSRYLVTSS